MKAKFDHRQQEAAQIVSFYFRPEKPLRYSAGQFIELTLPHPNPDERGINRWFTLSSSPVSSDLVSITTRYNPALSSSFKQALWKLEPGSVLTMSEPMGDFILPKDPSIQLIFVAGGIGITPFRSMLGWLLATKEQRPITMLYAIHDSKDQIFQDVLEQYNFEQLAVIIQEPKGPGLESLDQLSAERILAVAHQTASDHRLIYISGPEPMVEALRKNLIKLGVPDAEVVGDYFPNYQSI